MTNFIQVKTEMQAVKVIRKHLGRIYCPRCGKKHYIRKLPEGRYYCQKCRYKFSLKTLLGFKSSKLNYLQIVKLIYCFSKKYTLKSTMDIVLISYPAARQAYSRLRRLLPNDRGKLAGDVITDVMYAGKQKTDNQSLVSGAVNREFNYVNLEIVPDQEQGTLEKFIYDNIDHKNSLITTDSHQSYNDIEWMGYGHRRENHSKFELKLSVPIERVWALFKTLIKRTYHHIWKEKLPEYLVEFRARFNHRQTVNIPANLLSYLLSPCSRSFT
jgi:transposase-like protein